MTATFIRKHELKLSQKNVLLSSFSRQFQLSLILLKVSNLHNHLSFLISGMLSLFPAVDQQSSTNRIELEGGKRPVCGLKAISNRSTACINAEDTIHWTIKLNNSYG